MVKYLVLLLLSITLLPSCRKTQQEFPVQYRINMQNTWGVDSHPTDYPGNARLEPFLAVSHRSTTNLFNLSFPATEGIRVMAETGVMVRLEEEVDIQRGGDLALDRALGDRLSFFQTSSIYLGFNETHTYLTVMARIAPSPDWFVSAYKINLMPNGQWVDTLTIYPEAYDAGSDLSQTFTGDAIPANPPQTVSLMTSVPLANNGVVPPLAKIMVERIK
ncbi:hypothetical protein BH09BAC1_BH09BAC1_19360 [soil metagenome]